MKIRLHKESGLWVREDGAVLMPPGGHFRKFRWTFGSKGRLGYLQVNYRGKIYLVHRLIAGAFLDNPEGYPTVDHYPDRNPANNAVSNLRWADMHMQQNNRQICYDSLAKYGIRSCEDINGYYRARYAKNPEQERARGRGKYAKQKALGKHKRRCPDGKRRLLTDEEYNERYKDGLK